MASLHDIATRYESATEKSPERLLEILATEFGSDALFTSSLGEEDQALTHMILNNGLPIEIATIDTGRLFEETLETLERTNRRYGTTVRVAFPDAFEVERLVNTGGPLSFRNSVEERKECCRVRKVLPLGRLLIGKRCWITGIRNEQSTGRGSLAMFEQDEERGILKCHPLLHWTADQVRDYLRDKDIPSNPLHRQGYLSIGCAPCTRAVHDGEDPRAGRWWWEADDKRECGLHERQTVGRIS